MNIYIQQNENKFSKFYLKLKLEAKRKILIDITVSKFKLSQLKDIHKHIDDKLETFNNLYKLIILLKIAPLK